MDGVLTENASRRRATRWVVLVLLGEVALSVALGCYRLGAKQLWYDEAFSALAAGRGMSGAVHVAETLDANMPLYIFGLSIWRVFGDGEAALRMFSVTLAAAAVVAVYLLAERLFDRITGLLAGFLLAIAPFSVRYSQDLRAYSMLVFLGTASTYLFVLAVETRRTRWFVVYALVASASLYGHLAAAFIVLAQLVSLLALERSRIPVRKLAATALGCAVLLMPLLYFIAVALDHQGTVVAPTLRSVPRYLSNAAGGFWLSLVLGALALVPMWMLWTALRARNHTTSTWHLAVVASGIVVPFVGLYAAAVVQGRSWSDRYLITMLPFVVVAAAVGLRHIRRRSLVVGVLLLIVVLAGLKNRDWYDAPSVQDFGGVVEYLATNGGPDDGIVFCVPPYRVGFEYYELRLPASRRLEPLSPSDDWSRYPHVLPASAVDAATWISGPDRIWVVPSLRGTRPGQCGDEELFAGHTRTRRQEVGGFILERWDR